MSFACVLHLVMSSCALHHHVSKNLHSSGFSEFSPLSVLSPTTLARARCMSEIVFSKWPENVLGMVNESEGFDGLRKEREERCPAAVSETETSDELTDYNAAIVHRWGVKWTPNAMKLGRRPTYTIIRPHAKFQPNPRTFSGHL